MGSSLFLLEGLKGDLKGLKEEWGVWFKFSAPLGLWVRIWVLWRMEQGMVEILTWNLSRADLLWPYPGASVSLLPTLKFLGSHFYPNHSTQTACARSCFPVQNQKEGASIWVLCIVSSSALYSFLTAFSSLDISLATRWWGQNCNVKWVTDNKVQWPELSLVEDNDNEIIKGRINIRQWCSASGAYQNYLGRFF